MAVISKNGNGEFKVDGYELLKIVIFVGSILFIYFNDIGGLKTKCAVQETKIATIEKSLDSINKKLDAIYQSVVITGQQSSP